MNDNRYFPMDQHTNALGNTARLIMWISKWLLIAWLFSLMLGCSASTMEYLTREPTVEERLEKIERCQRWGGSWC